MTLRDLFETYLPKYERPFTHAAAAGSMCSYFSMRLDGAPDLKYVPSCANEYLLTTIVREYWNKPDATHLSDCGAVYNQAYENHFVSNLTLAAAASINAGMDMNSNTISTTQMGLAVELGLVSRATVQATASRVLANRFRVGQFDPLETQPATLLALGAADIGTNASRATAE